MLNVRMAVTLLGWFGASVSVLDNSGRFSRGGPHDCRAATDEQAIFGRSLFHDADLVYLAALVNAIYFLHSYSVSAYACTHRRDTYTSDE